MLFGLCRTSHLMSISTKSLSLSLSQSLTLSLLHSLSLSLSISHTFSLSISYTLSHFLSVTLFSEVRGIVVGIEQVKGLLRFVVEFGTDRELWSGKKVRKYCTAPVRDEESQAMDVSSDETYPPTLPSGYDYDDLDTVCGLARGNCGWGAPQCFLPPAVRYVHSCFNVISWKTLMISHNMMTFIAKDDDREEMFYRIKRYFLLSSVLPLFLPFSLSFFLPSSLPSFLSSLAPLIVRIILIPNSIFHFYFFSLFSSSFSFSFLISNYNFYYYSSLSFLFLLTSLVFISISCSYFYLFLFLYSDTHSIPAQLRSQVDPFFDLFRGL